MCSSNWKMVVAGAIFAVVGCVSSEAPAQGFRIGNFIQAGGGQGFRMGGPRFGMHFGGGQGATIGGQNLGMRFGNGQGARFGGVNYGMQFGGGQGTQFGQLDTTPNVAPGTYYYGDVRGSGYAQPGYVAQPGFGSVMPATVSPSPASNAAQVDATVPSVINGEKSDPSGQPANPQTQVGNPGAGTIVEPPAADNKVFDEFNQSDEKSVLITDEPDKVEVVPSAEQSGGGDK